MPTPLIVHGATGRMGRAILALAQEQPAFTLAGGVAVDGAGSLRTLGIASDAPLGTQLPVLPGALVIDFSAASAFPAVAAHCATHRMGLLSGTSGIAPAVLTQGLAAVATVAPALWAANMSVGVAVVAAVAAQLARSLGPDYDIEIVEAHHHHKIDAPSGTAYAIADAILGATGRTRQDLVHGRQGHVGARRPGEIGMHALRLGDVIGDHTVYFVGNNERILLGHVAHTREVFARGAVRVATLLAGRPPGTYTLPGLLGLA